MYAANVVLFPCTLHQISDHQRSKILFMKISSLGAREALTVFGTWPTILTYTERTKEPFQACVKVVTFLMSRCYRLCPTSFPRICPNTEESFPTVSPTSD
jgi:hypothetical protein